MCNVKWILQYLKITFDSIVRLHHLESWQLLASPEIAIFENSVRKEEKYL